MKVYFSGLTAAEVTYYQSELSDHELVFADSLDSVNDHFDTDVLCVFVNDKVTSKVINQLPNLQLITTRSTGFDHVDTATADQRNIKICNVPEYGSSTVAEFAFSLLLALSRKSYQAYDRLRSTGNTDVVDFEGFDLDGKTIGIIGTGRIGRHVARIANGFNMNIVAYDPYPNDDIVKAYQVEYLPLSDVLSRSDIISLHAPYNSDNHHLINRDTLAQMKPGAVLINTARGGLVDTTALLAALESGHISGAGLDVVEGEDLFGDELQLLTSNRNDIELFRELAVNHALLDMPNVILTPHIAFNTREAIKRINQTTISNIKSFVTNKPDNLVN